MPVEKLKKFLDEHNIKYVIIKHSPAFTAQEVAGLAHVPGKEMAKTVLVLVDGKMAMTVLPADNKVDFALLKKATGAKEVLLATEEEFKYRFPDCEVGAMPPFGNLYGMDVWIEKSLTKDEEIFFNACSHKDLIKMQYKDFETLVQPKIGSFALKRNYHLV
ncbi:MAG TPA: YbaK/EbsC family protein [bacterium]|nr:YbaK/EbsC family protein [bacterium]HPN42779.1 YbaK/EbsC family protein [bacterium]